MWLHLLKILILLIAYNILVFLTIILSNNVIDQILWYDKIIEENLIYNK